MFKVIQPVSDLLTAEHFITSDTLFFLNTKFTATLLTLFSVLLSPLDLLHRASIDCNAGSEQKKIVDSYCWSSGTFICKNNTSGQFYVIFQSFQVVMNALTV